LSEFIVEDISAATIPEDFSRNPKNPLLLENSRVMRRGLKFWFRSGFKAFTFGLFTQNKAKHFAVKGHARNLPDGRVEIIAP